MKWILVFTIWVFLLSAVSVSAYYRCPDVTNDGVVNIYDLSAVGLHAVSVCGEHLYNETFDINKDCAINESDLAIVGKWMDKTCLYMCPDLNDDGVVNIFDMAMVAKNMNSSCKFNKSADLNNDCIVNEIDLEILGDNYRCEGPDCIADINGDGEVGLLDLMILARSYTLRCYNETADVNKDCMVNETDTQIVGDWMGEICCRNGSTNPCGSDVGACEKGLMTCIENEWSDCVGVIEPINETCNDIDDDCNGLIDDNLIKFCGSDIGTCQSGMQMCTNGQWGDCIGDIPPTPEICDSLDNDCDGEVDEIGCACTTGYTRSCGSDIGRCEKGAQTCINGTWSDCIGAIEPANEICNSIDDDCDGLIDENLTHACGLDRGECISGLRFCTNGLWGECIGYVGPKPEICDGLDNNCDGLTDENLTRRCETEDTKGACRYGYEICINGVWSSCTGSKPMEETCNGIDDDCDGLVDETCPNKIIEMADHIITLESIKINLLRLKTPVTGIINYYKSIGNYNKIVAWESIMTSLDSIILHIDSVNGVIRDFVNNPTEGKLINIKNGINGIEKEIESLIKQIMEAVS